MGAPFARAGPGVGERAIARRPEVLGWGLPCSGGASRPEAGGGVESLGKELPGLLADAGGTPCSQSLGECVPGGATGQSLPGGALGRPSGPSRVRDDSRGTSRRGPERPSTPGTRALPRLVTLHRPPLGGAAPASERETLAATSVVALTVAVHGSGLTAAETAWGDSDRAVPPSRCGTSTRPGQLIATSTRRAPVNGSRPCAVSMLLTIRTLPACQGIAKETFAYTALTSAMSSSEMASSSPK